MNQNGSNGDLYTDIDQYAPIRDEDVLDQRGKWVIEVGNPQLRRAYNALGITRHHETTGLAIFLFAHPLRCITGVTIPEIAASSDLKHILTQCELYDGWMPFFTEAMTPKPHWSTTASVLATYHQSVTVIETNHNPVAPDEPIDPVVGWHCRVCHSLQGNLDQEYSDWDSRLRLAWKAWQHRLGGSCQPPEHSRLIPKFASPKNCFRCKIAASLPRANDLIQH